MREMRWKMCRLRLVREAVNTGSHLRWMQLWLVPGQMRDLRRPRSFRCLLLPRMHHIGKRRKKKNKRIQLFAFILISLNIFKLNFREMAARKSWILEAQKRIFITKEKNMASKRLNSCNFNVYVHYVASMEQLKSSLLFVWILFQNKFDL